MIFVCLSWPHSFFGPLALKFFIFFWIRRYISSRITINGPGTRHKWAAFLRWGVDFGSFVCWFILKQRLLGAAIHCFELFTRILHAFKVCICLRKILLIRDFRVMNLNYWLISWNLTSDTRICAILFWPNCRFRRILQVNLRLGLCLLCFVLIRALVPVRWLSFILVWLLNDWRVGISLHRLRFCFY